MIKRFQRGYWFGGVKNEQGQALVLVLAFLVAVGLLAAALAGQSVPSFVHSTAVKAVNDDVAAADQGINYAIQRLKTDFTLCPVNASSPTPITPDYVTPDSNLTVKMRCQTEQGFSADVFGWAIITNDTGAASITDSAGGNKKITGPVFSAGGWNLNPARTMTVKDGDVVAEGPGCTFPPNLIVTPVPPFSEACSTMAVPVPPHALPNAGPPGSPQAPKVVGGCTILYPGTYTTTNPPGLIDAHGHLPPDVYLVSGLYYFDNLGSLQVGNTLFGGQPGAETQQATTGSPCASDVIAGVSGVGSGVEIIFGGNTTLSIGNNSTTELYARIPPAGGSDDSATQGISLYQVPCASAAWSTGCAPQTSGWHATTQSPDTEFLSMGNGAHVFGAVHGAIYGPQGSLGVFATSDSIAVLGGGVDVFDLTLQDSASACATCLLVSVGLTPGQRRTVITSTICRDPLCGSDHGNTKPITARAVVQIANDPSRTTTIQSWRTCQDSNCPP